MKRTKDPEQEEDTKQIEVDYEKLGALRKEMSAYLEKVTIKEFFADEKSKMKPPVLLKASLTPKQAFQELMKNNVRCAPVVEDDKCVGVLDVRDFLKEVVEEHKKKHKAEAAIGYITGSVQVSKKNLATLASARPFWGIEQDKPVLNAVKMFGSGPHILAVLDTKTSAINMVISQGQLFRKIAVKFWKKLKRDISVETLMAAGVGSSPIICVGEDAKACEVFEVMAKNDLSGVAVLDEYGQLVHNTSASDIKMWLISSYTLEADIVSFLAEIRKRTATANIAHPCSTVNVDNKSNGMEKVVNKLSATKYHRLWVIDKESKPIGVVAITDIFKFVCGMSGLPKTKKEDDVLDGDDEIMRDAEAPDDMDADEMVDEDGDGDL